MTDRTVINSRPKKISRATYLSGLVVGLFECKTVAKLSARCPLLDHSEPDRSRVKWEIKASVSEPALKAQPALQPNGSHLYS